MKYYIIALMVLSAASAHAQVEIRVEQREDVRVRPIPAEVRTEKRAEVRIDNIKANRDEFQIEARVEKKDSGVRTLQDRVRTLTDINTGGGEILNTQFNIAQRLRLEGAGQIQVRKEERKEKIRNFISEKGVVWAEKKVMLGEKKLEKVSEKTNGIIRKLSDGITKLERTDARIQTLITDETSENVAVALNNAHVLLEVAQSSVAIVKVELRAQIETKDGTSLEAIKSLVETALTDLRAAWSAYIEVTALVKVDITQNN